MENILIIEDNQDVNLMLAQSIKSAGYGVKSSFTGIDGLNEIKTNSYSLVLLDIMLPYKSGDEILKEVRQFSQIPRYDKHKNWFVKTRCRWLYN